ncbi:MAG: YjgN family protein [Pseudomonadota bacterium]
MTIATDSTPDHGSIKPFVFHGSGKEYFGIWIVNILLTILTLGIYSAWAKVRNKRYFNGNTELDGHRFDYHARPVQILIGRLVVVAFLFVLNLLQTILPFVALFIVPLYLVLLPWVIVRGIRFNANMTSYRNVRFHFEGTKWGAFLAYILWPFAALLSLLTLTPFASRSNARFLGNGYAYGTARFSADPPLGPFYKALGIGVVIVLAFVGLAFALALVFGAEPEMWMLSDPGLVAAPILIGLYYAYYTYAGYARNISYNALALEGGHTVRSTLHPRTYAWIVISNLFLIIVTLTLYTPWAKVRVARYLADHTTLFAASDLDDFVEGTIDRSGVASGEFLTLEGYDLGL